MHGLMNLETVEICNTINNLHIKTKLLFLPKDGPNTDSSYNKA